MVETLSKEQIKVALENLSGWSVSNDGKAIEKTFKFKDFLTAVNFFNQCTQVIESMDHHPDWRNIYNKVHVVLCTHEAGGITERDVELARAMNRINRD